MRREAQRGFLRTVTTGWTRLDAVSSSVALSLCRVALYSVRSVVLSLSSSVALSLCVADCLRCCPISLRWVSWSSS